MFWNREGREKVLESMFWNREQREKVLESMIGNREEREKVIENVLEQRGKREGSREHVLEQRGERKGSRECSGTERGPRGNSKALGRKNVTRPVIHTHTHSLYILKAAGQHNREGRTPPSPLPQPPPPRDQPQCPALLELLCTPLVWKSIQLPCVPHVSAQPLSLLHVLEPISL